MAQTRREGAVVRLRIAIVVATGLLLPRFAEAQPGGAITGMLAAHIGAASGGDTDSAGLTPVGSMAVLESTGWGAELELGHTRGFASDIFEDSEITTVMVNAIGMWPRTRWRPFGTGGVGLMRVHAALAGDGPSLSRTDWGVNGGAGMMYVVNEAVGVRGDVRYFRYLQRHDDLPQSDRGYFDFWRTTIGVTWSWPIR